MLKCSGLSLLKISLPSIIIVFFYLNQYIGIPILYFQLDDLRLSDGVDNKYIVLEVFVYTSFTITLMIVGFLLGRKIFGPINNPSLVDIQPMGKNAVFGTGVLFLFCCAVLYFYLSKIGFENIAIIKVLTSDRSGLGALRSAMTNSFDGKYHWYHLFMNKLLIFTALIFFSQMLIHPSVRYKFYFCLVFLVTTFSMIMSIQKGPMAIFLIGLLFVFLLSRRSGIMPIMTMFKFSIMLLGGLIIFYIVFMGSNTPTEALIRLLSRIFTGGLQPAYHYLEFFPENQDFLLGRSLPNPGGLLPFESYALTTEILEWRNQGISEQGVVGSMPAVYWGEMYANFGLIGIIIPPFFVGFLLYGLNGLLMKLRANPLSVALFVWMIMHYKDLSSTSLSGYMFDLYLSGVLVAFLLITLMRGGNVFKSRSESHPIVCGKLVK